MRVYTADFETTTKIDDCRVWAWGVCDIANINETWMGTTLDSFMDWCNLQTDNPRILFHNLKFDSSFLISWLLKAGYKHVQESRDRATKTFKTMINSKGMFYNIEVIFYMKGKTIRKVTFQDSYKLIPLSVEDTAKAFEMPIQKLKLDYKCHDDLPEGAPLTEHEKEYLLHDIQIMARAVAHFYSQGYDKMTIGACALEEYKKLIDERRFKRFFPLPTYHEDVKQSYKGGFTYLNPKFAGKVVGNGIVLDINSMYPSIMASEELLLPHGTPIFFEGEYEPDPTYPLYTQMLRCQFELKEGKIPMIQIKNSLWFSGTEYLTSSNDEQVPLCLNSVDLELFKENYHIYNPEYMSGWKFRGAKASSFFGEYVHKWTNEKIKAKEEDNPGNYLISKLFMNSLSGKFGTDTTIKNKIPYLDEEGVVKYYDSEVKEKDGIYVAMSSFITSYGRDIIVRSAQKIADDYNSGKSELQFIYCDTDSLHILSPDFSLPEGLEINSTKLGAWDCEARFKSGKFLRSKCYMELHIISEEDYWEGRKGEEPYLYSKDKNGFYKKKITVAGMPSECYEQVNFSNFKIGANYSGKLQPRDVKGGVVLESVDFTIKKH